MSLAPAARRRLGDLGSRADAEMDIAEAALRIAAVRRSGAAPEPYLRHLDHLAAEVGTYLSGAEAAAGLALRIEALVQVVSRRYGYGGALGEVEGEDDPDDCDLMRVIDRRRGAAVAVAIVAMAVARRCGWRVEGLDFPGRFLVRLRHGGDSAILSPFDGGRVMATPDLRAVLKAAEGPQAELTVAHHAAVNNRRVLLVLAEALKDRLLERGRLSEALAVIEPMLAFAPDQAMLWREAGRLNLALERHRAAVAALEESLRYEQADRPRYETSVLLQELRGRPGSG